MLMEENMQQQAEFVKKNNEKKKLAKRSNNSLTACRARTGSSRVVSDAQRLTWSSANFEYQDWEDYYRISSLECHSALLNILLVCYVELLFILHSSNCCGPHKENQSSILVLIGLDLSSKEVPPDFPILPSATRPIAFLLSWGYCTKALWALWNVLEKWIIYSHHGLYSSWCFPVKRVACSMCKRHAVSCFVQQIYICELLQCHK